MILPEPQTVENPRVPAPPVTFVHTINIQMRFCDTDMLGHVNNNAYLTYTDIGKVAYFERALTTHELSMANVVIGHYEVDFYAPTFISEKLAVQTAVLSVGDKSLTLEQRVISRTGMTKCVVRSVMVCVDPDTGRSKSLDPMVVKSLEEYEGRPLHKS